MDFIECERREGDEESMAYWNDERRQCWKEKCNWIPPTRCYPKERDDLISRIGSLKEVFAENNWVLPAVLFRGVHRSKINGNKDQIEKLSRGSLPIYFSSWGSLNKKRKDDLKDWNKNQHRWSGLKNRADSDYSESGQTCGVLGPYSSSFTSNVNAALTYAIGENENKEAYIISQL